MATGAPSDTTVEPHGPGRVAKAAVATSAALQLGSVTVVVALRLLADDAVGDRLGVLPLGAVYGLPAVLAGLSFRRRPRLLLAAGVASLVLAVFPFSLHSFVFGPVGLVYLVVQPRWPTPPHGGQRAAAVAVVVPVLLLLAFIAFLWHEDPICYARHDTGEVTIDRDPGQVTSGSMTIEPGSGIVERGCSGDTVVWWEAASSLALSGGALAAAIYLTRPTNGSVLDKP